MAPSRVTPAHNAGRARALGTMPMRVKIEEVGAMRGVRKAGSPAVRDFERGLSRDIDPVLAPKSERKGITK